MYSSLGLCFHLRLMTGQLQVVFHAHRVLLGASQREELGDVKFPAYGVCLPFGFRLFADILSIYASKAMTKINLA